jgi:hypothetical protein
MSQAVHHAVDGRLAESGWRRDDGRDSHRQAQRGRAPGAHRASTSGPEAAAGGLLLRAVSVDAGDPSEVDVIGISPDGLPSLVASTPPPPSGSAARPTSSPRTPRTWDISPRLRLPWDAVEARDALAWVERLPPSEAEGWMAVGAAWTGLASPTAPWPRSARPETAKAGPNADVGAALLARAGRMVEAGGCWTGPDAIRQHGAAATGRPIGRLKAQRDAADCGSRANSARYRPCSPNEGGRKPAFC